jgi:outer membrane protein OmpA-like peptidoglycan-associated protein
VTEGTVSSTNAPQSTLDTTGVSFPPGGQVQTKTITATATVTDDFGGSASCTSSIQVSSNPQTTHYGDILFGEGSPRVNNYAKRILLERLYPDLTTGIYKGYTVVLVGHVDPSERASRNLDRQRVLDAAAVLTATKGPSGKNNCADLKPSDFTVDWVGTAVTDVQDISVQPVPQERAPDRVNADDPRAKNRRVEIWVVPPGKSVPSPPVREAHQLPLPELRRLGCPQ